jgi:hypothetical protein
MLRAISKVWRLPFAYKIVAIKAFALFIYWNILISWIPYRIWKTQLFKKPQIFSDGSLEDITKITQLIEKVARHHIVKINCLRRCAVQKQILAQMGYPAELVFGVKKQQNLFAAHCWLTYKSKIINDSIAETSHYVPLVSQNDEQSNILKKLK